jgi:HD-like signal output (HDOD) protein
VLGISHPNIGGFLCHFWNFPTWLVQCVFYHHAPLASLNSLQEFQHLTKAVNAACRLAHLEVIAHPDGRVEFPALNAMDKEVLDAIQVTPMDIEKQGALVVQEAQKTMEIFV